MNKSPHGNYVPKHNHAAANEDDFVINYQGTFVHANEIECIKQMFHCSACIL